MAIFIGHEKFSGAVKLKVSTLNQDQTVSKLTCPDFELTVGDTSESHLVGYKNGNEIFINDITSKDPALVDIVGLYIAGFPVELQGVQVDLQIKSTNSNLPAHVVDQIDYKYAIYTLDDDGVNVKNSYVIAIDDAIFHSTTEVTDIYNGIYNLTISFLGVSRYLTLHIEL